MTDLSDRPAGAEPPERPQDVTASGASVRSGPQPGDPAPDVALRDTAGDEGRLSALWTRAPRGLALIFLRHFGWAFCREHAAQLRRDHDRFGAAGLHIVAVGQGTPAEAARFQRRLKLPYPVLVDPNRAAYRAYGLREGSVGEVAGPGVALAFVRSILRGHLPGRVRGNALQLQGEFLIDRQGILRYAVRPERSSDIPSTQALLDAARDLL